MIGFDTVTYLTRAMECGADAFFEEDYENLVTHAIITNKLITACVKADIPRCYPVSDPTSAPVPVPYPTYAPGTSYQPALSCRPRAQHNRLTMSRQETEEYMQVILNAIPRTLEEFYALPQCDLSKPENTCALLLLALNLHVQDKNAGIEAVNFLHGPQPLSGYGKQFIRDRLMDKPYLPLAYLEGATPQNNYAPSQPLALQVLPDPRAQDIEEGYIRVFLKTAGADSPRPVKLRRKGAEWYLWEYSSILVGIRIPAQSDPWA